MSKIKSINDSRMMKQIQESREIAAELLPDYGDAEVELPATLTPVRFEEDAGNPIEEQSALDDFKFARETMHVLIENGQTALAELLKVAMLSDYPRAYEVVSTMMKTLTDTTKEMIALQEKMLDLQNKANVKKPEDDTELNIGFSCSTAELLDAIELK